MHQVKTFVMATLLILSSGCTLFVDRNDVAEPSISLKQTELASISLEGVELNLTLSIFNPNRFDMNLAGFDYTLSLNSYQVLSDQQRQNIELSGRDTTVVQVPVTVKFEDVHKLVSSITAGDQVDYRFRTTAYVDIPVIGMRHINSRHYAHFPMPKQPAIGISAMDIQDVNSARAKAVLTLDISNPNNFEIAMKEFDYQFFMGKTAWVENANTDIKALAGKERIQIKVPVTLPFSQMDEELAKRITENTASLEYQLKGDMVMDSPLPHFQHMKTNINQWGLIHPDSP